MINNDSSQAAPEHGKQAVYWYEKAIEQGNADAQFMLGLCYYDGIGVLKNYKQAYLWISLSLVLTTDAKEAEERRTALKDIELDMTNAQVAEAQEMAAKWLLNYEADNR